MSIMDDYKQLRMIENIKNLKEMEIAYKANLKLCKYQEQQINKLATCIEKIKEITEEAGNTQYLTFPDFNLKQNVKMLMGQFNGYLQQILQKISECEGEQ